MPNIEVSRDKEFLFFKLPDGRMDVRYNLKAKRMEYNSPRAKTWVVSERRYDYFKNFHVSDLTSTEEKFVALIKKAKEMNSNCRSVSTFIARLDEALIFEEYEYMGVKYECTIGYRDYRRVITKPLSFYDKHLQLMFKISGQMVTADFERDYEQNKERMIPIIHAVSTLELSPEEIKEFLNSLDRRWNYIEELINIHKYETKALFSFVLKYLKVYEDLGADESLILLNDYYSMGAKIGRQLKRYPKYLKSMHDIITANYKAFKRDYDEIKFQQLQLPDLEFEKGKFAMVMPKQSKDIISEGTNLNHCVASYVDSIIRGDCLIVFLRSKEFKDQSLVTVEIKNKNIVQARGSYNRELAEEEKKFLEAYAKEKELEIKL